MKARARVRAEIIDGRVAYPVLRSDPPLLLRPTPDELLLVGGAAGPLGGDDLRLDIEVGPGVDLKVRSAAATLALPGPAPSRMMVTADVAAGACLRYEPQPLVSAAASDHRQRADIRLADDAVLRWSETLILGRSGEPGGRLDSTVRVERAGRAVAHQQLRLGPDMEDDDGWWADPDSPAVLGGQRAVMSVLEVDDPSAVDPSAADPSTLDLASSPLAVVGPDRRSAAVTLQPGVRLLTACGVDAVIAARRLEDLALTMTP